MAVYDPLVYCVDRGARCAIAALAVAALLTGCKAPTEPVAPASAAAQNATAQKVAGKNPLAQAGQLTSAPPPEETEAERRKRIEAVALEKLAAGGPLPGLRGVAGMPIGDLKREVARPPTAVPQQGPVAAQWMVKRIKNVAANHNKAGLQRHCTPRLIAEIDAMLPKHGERFWRHMDRYVTAAASGYEITARREDAEKKLHLTVKAAGDIVLKPVLVRGSNGWQFDRF